MNQDSFFRMRFSKCISIAPIKGFKKSITKITLAFTVSLEEKRPMFLVIGNARRPRSLKILIVTSTWTMHIQRKVG